MYPDWSYVYEGRNTFAFDLGFESSILFLIVYQHLWFV